MGIALTAMLTLPKAAHAQGFMCEDQIKLDDEAMACYQQGPQEPPVVFKAYEPPPPESPFKNRILRYAQLATRHRLNGLASYYSTSLDGTLTANGERYRNSKYSAAHLTLPLGCWVEVRSRATGRKIRLRVNDRGPYVRKFVLDLSQAAARAIGVDVADDRRVDIRIIAMPGEDPLPDTTDVQMASAVNEEAVSTR